MMATTRAAAWQASRLACVMTVTLVFLTGAIAGAVAMNLGAHRYMHRSVPFWTEGGKEVWLQRWKKDLNLTPEQSQEMTLILDDSEVVLKAGDTAVQRGTIHNWANRGTEPVVIAYIMLSCPPVTAGGKALEAKG